jgi:hypothetical protein
MRARRVATAVAVAAVLALAAGQHALRIAGIQRVSHDDTISYLAATGHQGEFDDVVETASAPVAQWVDAAEWQRFISLERRLPLLTIARDLGHHDIHPPVYFLLLHLWILLVGVHLYAGPVLNLLLHALTGIVLWRLARRLTGSPVAAWAAAGLWATLPAVAETATSTRQYSLAGLWSVACAAAFIRTREEPSRRALVVLGAVTALGLLTLYSFGVVVAGLGLVCLTDLRVPVRRRAAVAQLGALAAGGVVFLLGQPWLRETLARQQEQVETYSPELAWSRVGVLLRNLPRFAVADLPALAGLAVLAATLVLAVLAWRIRPAARPLIWLAVWVSAVLDAAFVAVMTPGAAHEARYFSIALPYLALLPAMAWPYLRVRTVLTIAVAAFVAAGVVNATAATRAANPPPPARLADGRPVVLDNLARGVLLRILWDAPSTIPVYAADQERLLETTERWLDCDVPSPCHDRAVTFATQVQYEATEEGQRELLEAAAQVRRVTAEPALDDLAMRYRLSAPIAGSVERVGATVEVSDTASHAGGRSRTASTMIPTSTTARSAAAAASASNGADGVFPWRRASHQNSVQ